LVRRLRARSLDWAQTRPEWGLAGNAAFIAAPRDRTRGIDLRGRAFLHDYDWRQDRDFGTLELIMTAPMVVAAWINLQYYGSTVNNQAFGCGNKVLHNVTGTIGVLEGNAGYLKPACRGNRCMTAGNSCMRRFGWRCSLRHRRRRSTR
jgi:uncharacterized protein YbcC (UPF0753/DUF2309 family)